MHIINIGSYKYIKIQPPFSSLCEFEDPHSPTPCLICIEPAPAHEEASNFCEVTSYYLKRKSGTAGKNNLACSAAFHILCLLFSSEVFMLLLAELFILMKIGLECLPGMGKDMRLNHLSKNSSGIILCIAIAEYNRCITTIDGIRRLIYTKDRKTVGSFKKSVERSAMKLVFDTETTGLNPMEDEILQLSIIDENENVLFNDYIRPSHKTTWPDAERINHISYEMVKDKMTFQQRSKEIQSIFSRADALIAYNGNFDIRFLRKHGIIFPDVPVYDVMLEFAPVYGEWNDTFENWKWQKLVTAAKYYGYDYSRYAHDSLEDVKATLFVYNRLHERE